MRTREEMESMETCDAGHGARLTMCRHSSYAGGVGL